MFAIQAAVTVVTAGLAIETFGLSWSPAAVSAGITVMCLGVLRLGAFKLFDLFIKVLMVVLTVSTLAATALALGRVDFGQVPFPPVEAFASGPSVAFIAALVGWMPGPVDISVWQSLWQLARRVETGHRPTLREALWDHHLGYVGTGILAVCFLLMGAGIMYGSGTAFAPSAAGFAHQIVLLYTDTLGDWSGPIVGVAALAVMFSTTLTVIDAVPRALAVLVDRFRSAEAPADKVPADSAGTGTSTGSTTVGGGRNYWVAAAVLGLGSVLILWRFVTSLKTMVDLATTASFLTAPALAWFNHRAMVSEDVPVAQRPGAGLRLFSLVGVGALAAIAVYYLVFVLTMT